jgi:hypothetical protein
MYVAVFSEIFKLLRLGAFDKVYFQQFFVQVSMDLGASHYHRTRRKIMYVK